MVFIFRHDLSFEMSIFGFQSGAFTLKITRKRFYQYLGQSYLTIYHFNLVS